MFVSAKDFYLVSQVAFVFPSCDCLMVARESLSFHCLCWISNGYLFYWLRGVNDCCRFSLRGLPIRCLSLRRWLALLDFSISPRLLGDYYWVFPKMVLGPTWFCLLNLTAPCYSLWFETKAIRKRWLKVVDNFYSSKLMNKSRWQLYSSKLDRTALSTWSYY